MSYTVPYRTEVGYKYPVFDVMVSDVEQRRLHGYCDIAETVYGDFVDPTFVARDPILLNTQTVLANHPERAPVHIVHRLEQLRPIRLGETLKMHGRVSEIGDHPKGWTLTTIWEYRDEAGEIVFVATPDVLMIDPERSENGRKRDEERKLEGEEDTFEVLTRKNCTPETTLGYCEGSTNKIHLDPETAQSFGFRAPIIAGNQTVNFMMEGVCRNGLPDQLSIEARLLRPVFWDDTVDVQGRANKVGRLSDVRVINGDGKTVADLQVRSVCD
jgi:acyl dehydratase